MGRFRADICGGVAVVSGDVLLSVVGTGCPQNCEFESQGNSFLPVVGIMVLE